MRTLLVAIVFLSLVACQEDPGVDGFPVDDLLIGAWSHSEYSDSITTLTRMRSLPKNEYGISFLEGGDLLEWKNSGWCGTPPIAYGEFEGTWEFAGDSVLVIQTDYWGGEMILKWHILEIGDHYLSYWIDHNETIYIEEE